MTGLSINVLLSCICIYNKKHVVHQLLTVYLTFISF